MNLLIPFIALAAHAAAPNVGLEPAVAASAAIAAVQPAPPVLRVSHAQALYSPEPTVLRVSHAQPPPSAVPTVLRVSHAQPPRVAVYPGPLPGTPCSLRSLLASRFLSGPWSAARRLEAARRRSDEAEMRRMETVLDHLFSEALILGI